MNCGLLLFGLSYQAILSLDALRTRNNVQMYNVCVCNILLVVFSVMSYGQTDQVIAGLSEARAMGNEPLIKPWVNLWASVHPVLLTSSVIVAISTLGLFYYGYKLHIEFAWAIYRHVSGSQEAKRRFLTYKVCMRARNRFTGIVRGT